MHLQHYETQNTGGVAPERMSQDFGQCMSQHAVSLIADQMRKCAKPAAFHLKHSQLDVEMLTQLKHDSSKPSGRQCFLYAAGCDTECNSAKDENWQGCYQHVTVSDIMQQTSILISFSCM